MKLYTLTFFSALLTASVATFADTPVQYGHNQHRSAVVHAEDLPSRLSDENALWKIELNKRPYFNAPQIDGDIAYAPMDAAGLPSEGPRNAAGMLCFNVKTGEILWEKILDDVRVDSWGASIIPILEEDRIYWGVQKTATCMDRDGNVLWQTNVGGPYVNSVHGTHSSGLVIGDYWWYPTGYSPGGDCPDWQNTSLDAPWHPNFVVINKHTGEIVAQDDTIVDEVQHGQWSSLSYGEVDGQGMVFWGDGHGMVHAYRVPESFEEGKISTVERLWTVDGNPPEYRVREDGVPMPYNDPMSNPGPQDIGWCEIIAPIVFDEGRIYVAIGRDKAYSPRDRKDRGRHIGKGAVTCFDVTGEEPEVVWRNLDVHRTFCPVSIYDGKVIVADHAGWVTAMDLETGETIWVGDINACIWNYFQCVGDEKIYVMNERRDFHIFDAHDGTLLYHTLMDYANNPMVGMTDGILVVSTMRSIAGYGGPEYMKTHEPMPVPERRQFDPDSEGKADSIQAEGH